MTKLRREGSEAGHRSPWPSSVTSRQGAHTILALIAGLALRLFFVLRYAHIVGDSLIYGDIARNLIQHGVYGFSTAGAGHDAAAIPTLIRLPGYPLFLAVCFLIFGVDHYTAVMFVQAGVDLCTCLLASHAAKRIFGPEAGRWTLWLGALCPFIANYVAAPLTETLTLFCIALAFYSLVRWQEREKEPRQVNRWLLVLGFALAYAILLRPEQGLLGAAVLPAMLFIRRQRPGSSRRGIIPIVVAASLALLPLVPWAARNWNTFRVIQPLAPRFATDPGEVNPSGFQRWFRTWAIDFASTENVYWNYDAAAIQIADLPNRAFDSNAQYEATRALLEKYNESTSATEQLDQAFAALAQDRIDAAPVRYFVVLPLARVANMTFRPRTENLPVQLEWWKLRSHPRATVFASLYGLLNLAYVLLATVTAVRWQNYGRFRPIILAMLATVGLRLALLLTLDNSEPRYTLEFFPVLFILGGAALVKLRGRDVSTPI